jgi:hypothetical protein
VAAAVALTEAAVEVLVVIALLFRVNLQVVAHPLNLALA